MAPSPTQPNVSTWETADLPEPPRSGRRLWINLIGPGVVLAGTSIGTGEWLFGPAVSAQYGASLFWLALISILLQGFCNLMFMRYAIYCGEPMNVGILRTWPGPAAWILLFAILDLTSVWPYNASNAAVPLATAILGRLPHAGDALLVKGLGISIFLLAFVPLVFGGTVYRMLEKIMAAKLVVVLGYLSVIAVTMVSLPVIWDVLTGFVRVGTVPLRPEVLVVGRHFSVRNTMLGRVYLAKGTWERKDNSVTGELVVTGNASSDKYNLAKPVNGDPAAEQFRTFTLNQSRKYVSDDSDPNSKNRGERFRIEILNRGDVVIAEGNVVGHHDFQPTSFQVQSAGVTRDFASVESLPEQHRALMRNHLRHEGLAYVNLIGYVRENKKLPPLDWAIIVAFVAIAGAGGLTNSMFSNYARDKGWGMGSHVGAIPSAFGGVTVGLSHVGKIFPLTDENRSRWRGWIKHIGRDQAIWIAASIIGMALPCMMSLEFIRNASVVGDRVAAMSAEGIATRYPAHASLFWYLTLFCGFLVLAPGQVSVGDQISRRWTDMIWHAVPRVKRLGEVRYVYYGILATYGVIGLFILTILPAVQIAKISAVLQNIALGSTALMSLYVNRRLLPKELHPSLFHQLGVVICGLFFLSISGALLFIL